MPTGHKAWFVEYRPNGGGRKIYAKRVTIGLTSTFQRKLGVWHPPADIVTTYPNLQVLFSLGAGVDQLDLAALPSDLPVIRMIEPGISDGMAEYATLGVLVLHRHVSQQRRGDWRGIRFAPAAGAPIRPSCPSNADSASA
jgi:hypothetical protein